MCWYITRLLYNNPQILTLLILLPTLLVFPQLIKINFPIFSAFFIRLLQCNAASDIDVSVVWFILPTNCTNLSILTAESECWSIFRLWIYSQPQLEWLDGDMIGIQMSRVQSQREKHRENNHITRTPIINPGERKGESLQEMPRFDNSLFVSHP